MTSHHRSGDAGLVLAVHDLVHRIGLMRDVRRSAEAPERIGSDVIAVPAHSPIELDLRLEAVSEGVLVSGTATVELTGVCGRCLETFDDEHVAELQELFVNPSSDVEDSPQVVDDTIDVEPLVRDQVVLELPFTPLCDEDCPGLCPECGARLADDPGHGHEPQTDARWSALADWTQETTAAPPHNEGD